MSQASSSSPRFGRRAFVAASALSAARVRGANDRIRSATIGAGGRGQYLTSQFKSQDAEVAAVCDVYEPNLAAGLKAASPGARGYVDYRRLLEDKSLDAVVIATPDHLHAPMLIDAVGAGKDVYVEKPLAHTIEEGFRMVAAVRSSRQVCQVGTQRRSYDLNQEAKQILDSGVTGPIRLVNVWWMNHMVSLGKPQLKGKLEWDLFLGPAPRRPLDPLRFVHWLQFFDYSGGYLIGQAAHIVDSVQWMMKSTYPLAVTCAAGQVNLEGGEVPETASLSVEYPENYLLVFTITYKGMRYRMANDQMQQFHGTKARFDLGRESYALYQESSAVELKPVREKRQPDTFELASRAHVANFLECMRTRKDPVAPIEVGNSTNIVLCLAIESMRAGRRVRWNQTAKRSEA
jgi:predicted dehydrogenase